MDTRDHPNAFQVMPSQGPFLQGQDQVDPPHHWKDEGMSTVSCRKDIQSTRTHGKACPWDGQLGMRHFSQVLAIPAPEALLASDLSVQLQFWSQYHADHQRAPT